MSLLKKHSLWWSVKMKITGSIEITFKKENDYIYQTIRIIPNAMKNLHYFTQDKYKLGRKVDDFLSGLYLGDMENILFIENNKYRNMNTIKYQILNSEFPINLSPQKYFFEEEIPAKDSCLVCSHMRPLSNSENIRCLYFKEFMKIKVHCIDFCEK